MPPVAVAGAAAAANPWISALGLVGGLVQGIIGGPQSQLGPAGLAAAQPSAVAAQQYGLWGPAAQQGLAMQSSFVFANQSPAALAALNAPGAEDNAIANVFAGIFSSGRSSTGIPWGPIIVVLVLLFLFKKVT